MEDAFRINNKSQKKRNDTSVQGTNDSSVLSKISTCQAGYFDDNYLKFFANKIAKRSSLVNRFLIFKNFSYTIIIKYGVLYL